MLKGKALENIIPQSYPMIMIDTLVISDRNKTVTGFLIKEENVFVYKKRLQEPGIIENMAQTAAARSGYKAYTDNTEIRNGYIGAIKNLNIFSLPKINETLQTILTPLTDIGNISAVKIETLSGKQKIAECSMTIILSD